MKKKSFLESMIDSAVIFIAEKYGFGTEEEAYKKENRDLRYQYMMEKAKNIDNTIAEVSELKNEVKKLTEEKIKFLEKEIQRLEYENKHYKQIAYKEVLQLDHETFTLSQISRFIYKDGYIKYITHHGITNVLALSEEELVLLLQTEFKNIRFLIEKNQLILTFAERTFHKSKFFSLESFVSVADIKKIDEKAGIL